MLWESPAEISLCSAFEALRAQSAWRWSSHSAVFDEAATILAEQDCGTDLTFKPISNVFSVVFRRHRDAVRAQPAPHTAGRQVATYACHKNRRHVRH